MPQTAAGREITINGYTFGRFERRLVEEYVDWAKTQVPDALQIAIKQMDRLEVEADVIQKDASIPAPEKARKIQWITQKQEWLQREAIRLDQGGLTWGSQPVEALLRTEKGQLHFFKLILKKHHPDLTYEQIEAVLEPLTREDLDKIIEVVSGKVPPGNAEPHQAS